MKQSARGEICLFVDGRNVARKMYKSKGERRRIVNEWSDFHALSNTSCEVYLQIKPESFPKQKKDPNDREFIPIRRVVDPLSNKIFESIGEAAAAAGMNKNTFYQKISGLCSNDTGFLYLYIGEDGNPIPPKEKPSGKKAQGVVLVDVNGNIYRNIKHASDALSVNYDSLWNQLNGRYANKSGLRFQKVA